MAGGPTGCPDWRNAGDYLWLEECERAGFAWEWLRRDPCFKVEALAAISTGEGRGDQWTRGSDRWGLVRFEDPGAAYPDARPLWRRSAHPWVVPAVARDSRDPPDAFSLGAVASLSKLVGAGDRQHLLLSDGLRSLRLDCIGRALGEGPVELSFALHGLASLERPLAVLARLRFLAAHGRLSRQLQAPQRAAHRMILVLRAADGLRSGASQADVAFALLSPKLERRGWRIASPSLRSRAQRLCRAARAMERGGWRRLLD